MGDGVEFAGLHGIDRGGDAGIGDGKIDAVGRCGLYFPADRQDASDAIAPTSPDGVRIGQIRLPETCDNLCFGGAKRNRLFITAGQSLYAVYVETQGAHWC